MASTETPSSASPASDRRRVAAAVLGLAVATVLTYLNSFDGVFLLDDQRSIVANESIRQLWPLSGPLFPPPSSLQGRPIASLTFAVNASLHDTAVWGYHAVNLAVHLAAGLVLFGFLRRTLLLPRLAPRWGRHALSAAFFVSLLWLLHPLQTESVTYIVQRIEALVGFFYLLTFYCFVRSVGSPHPGRWHSAAVAACTLGMGSKEVMVSAPLLVLLFDRTFVANSFREAWHARRRLYLGLAATWLLLAVLVIGTQGRGGSAGFATPVAWWQYAFTQCWAIPHYLRLSLWPHPLVFDYGTDLITAPARVLPGALLLIALGVATIYATVRRQALGFVGVWFFALLAPSSSIVPIATQTIAEHRMYLPLAAVLAVTVLALHGRIPRQAWLPLTGIALAFAAVTHVRNVDYHSALSMWAKTVAQRPLNARAHDNLAHALARAGRLVDALPHHERAVELAPTDAVMQYNFGSALIDAGRFREASVVLRTALGLDPEQAVTHNNLAIALVEMGQPEAAVNHYEEATRLQPRNPAFRYNHGTGLLRLNRPADAAARFRAAIALDPHYALAHHDLGAALMQLGRLEEALAAFQTAVRLEPTDARARHNLGNVFGALGRMPEACVEIEAALRLDPNFRQARLSLADARLQMGEPEQAVPHYRHLLQQDPANAAAHKHLGVALAQLQQLPSAIAHLEEAVRLRPGDPDAHFWLGNALAAAARPRAAAASFEAAVRLDPNHAPAREHLARLRDEAAPRR